MEPKYTAAQLGICAKCKRMELCTSRKNWIGPIIDCEDFDDRRATAPDLAVESQSFAMNKSIDLAAPEEAEIYKGICSNCDNRETCGYRTSDQAVWYCEEYSLAPLPTLIPDTLLPPFGVKRPAEEDAKRKRPELQADDIDAILKRRGAGPGVRSKKTRSRCMSSALGTPGMRYSSLQTHCAKSLANRHSKKSLAAPSAFTPIMNASHKVCAS
jgi:hypothetical protein